SKRSAHSSSTGRSSPSRRRCGRPSWKRRPTPFAGRTQLTNTGTSQLFFNGGSRTFVGTPATANNPTAAVDLNGKNATVAGGLFVNNGIVVDNSTGDFL